MKLANRQQPDAQEAVSRTNAAGIADADPWGRASRRKRLRLTGIRIAGAVWCAVVPLAALAELSNDPLLGPGLRYRPAYDGSRATQTELVPVIRYFGDAWFVRSTQGVLETGVRSEFAPGLHVGAQLAYEPGRKTGDSVFLRSHQIADIQAGASAGLQLEWDQTVGPVPLTLLTRVRQNFDSDRGAQVDLRLSAGVFKGGPVSAGIFGQATWANAKSTTSLYGIAPRQSASTGLPAFQPGGGWLFTSFGLLWSVDLDPKWVIVGSLESRRLSGTVYHSPLAERRSNSTISAGIAYHF